jgi:peptide/nickel transport system ATP-binding protein
MEATELLEVRNLSVAFQRIDPWGESSRIEVLRRLSLTLSEGEVVAVVGSSGSGKSVLAHSILGILPSNAEVEGTILYRGEALTARRLEQVRGREVAFLPQSITYLDPLVKAKHAVRWAARMSGSSRVEARTAQERTFLRLGISEEVGDRFPFQLSGGMVRRLLLAIAIVGRARLLIADEPTPGLDGAAVNESLNCLRELADSGSSVLLVSHDIVACLSVADRLAVFQDGCIVEVAGADAFSGRGERLRHPYSRALWNALPGNLFQASSGAGGDAERASS